MAQNKEQLNKLILFIKRLIEEPGNEDFVKKLRELLSVPIHNSVDDKRISNIEKYLGLDYELDSLTPDIDYSFVTDDYVRERLESDYREMLRYRYGLRGHKVDFKEVCRFSIFQQEMLLNYYYTKHFYNMTEVIEYLCSHTKKEGHDKIRKYEALRDVPLATKQEAYADENGKEYILDNARKVRNELSHRSTEKDSDDIMQLKEYLEELGVKISNNGFINYEQFKENVDFKKEIYREKKYWAFNYMVWKNKQPSDEVIQALNKFVSQIKNKI